MPSQRDQHDSEHPREPPDAAGELEEGLGDTRSERYILRLYVAGTTPNSLRAIENTRALLQEHMPERYELQIIDIYQQPIFARDGQIVAAPTLVKELPPPLRRFIGDMSQTERLLVGLDLRQKT